ncbi:hypothetical protein FOYG_06048 [Fusarium oxysporum NRRL 32931]|uniref:Uncharacterized protein n=1 Tax=Fusarium oxysporum NRRL 32931 TaxID=660029 RepID=W9ICZ3_FUSOX|nr:hypothetical protein FOYG_06048 [Fusarium oxysporum NRRL 32931]
MHLLELHDDSFFDPHGRLAGSYTATDLTPDKFPYWDDEFGSLVNLVKTRNRRSCLDAAYVASSLSHVTLSSQPQKSSLARSLGGDRTSYGVGYTELLPSVEAARVRRLKKRFAQELIAIVGYRLPFEICENIGRYCFSGYATKLINDVWSNKDFAGPRDATLQVTKSRSIWAQHIEFEGLQYIKSLSTTRKSESDTKLFEATSGIRVSVYFAEDCLGIREVVITQDDNTT